MSCINKELQPVYNIFQEFFFNSHGKKKTYQAAIVTLTVCVAGYCTALSDWALLSAYYAACALSAFHHQLDREGLVAVLSGSLPLGLNFKPSVSEACLSSRCFREEGRQ